MSVFMRMSHVPSGMIASAIRAAPAAQRLMFFGGNGGASTGARAYTHESPKDPNRMYATTVLSVRKNGKVVIIGDGQVGMQRTAPLLLLAPSQDNLDPGVGCLMQPRPGRSRKAALWSRTTPGRCGRSSGARLSRALPELLSTPLPFLSAWRQSLSSTPRCLHALLPHRHWVGPRRHARTEVPML